MTQTFTLDDVARYAYQEMSAEEAKKFEKALVLDSELMDMFQKFDTVIKLLDNTPVLKEPNPRTVDRILAYSRTYGLAAAAK